MDVQKTKLCHCKACIELQWRDPVTNLMQPGKFVTPNDYRNHNRRKSTVHNPLCEYKDDMPPPNPSMQQNEEQSLAVLANIEHELVMKACDDISATDLTPYPLFPPTFPLAEEEEWAVMTLAKLQTVVDSQPTIQVLKASLLDKTQQYLLRVETLRKEWTEQTIQDSKSRHAVRDGNFVHTDCFFRNPLQRAHPLVLLSMFIATALFLLGDSTQSSSNFLLCMMRVMARTTYDNILSHSGEELADLSFLKKVAEGVPLDIRTARKHFSILPQLTIFAVCPACHFCHAPISQADGSRTWPKNCNHSRSDSKTCSELLLHQWEPRKPGSKKRLHGKPLRPFGYYDLASWLGGLLSRPGMERQMDSAWKPDHSGDLLNDIWDGSAVRDIPGPDGIPFLNGTSREGRYIFSLSVDGFNPLGNRAAGKSKSIMPITLVCMNLPPELRYKAENIFLAGIIPGPSEPKSEQLNQYLEPLVKDLQELWSQGVRFSCTFAFPNGRQCRCALGPLVCDSPAAAQVAGHSGHSAMAFCRICTCTKAGLQETGERSWPLVTKSLYLEHAQKWLDHEDQREEIYRVHGIRWSPLLKLSYWDITRFVVIDPMHSLFLGLIHIHCRKLFGISNTSKEEEPKTPKSALKAKEDLDSDVAKLIERLQSSEPPTLEVILRNSRSILEAACQKLNLNTPIAGTRKVPTKNDFATVLIQSANVPAQFVITGAKMPPKLPVIGRDTCRQIDAVLAWTTLPSWVGRPPPKFGAASSGKLTADQWRTAGTITLPMTLIGLWSTPGSTQRQRDLLQNFMNLVLAIESITKRSISRKQMQDFTVYYTAYLQGIKKLFPHFKLHPNHHYATHLPDFLERFGPVHSWWAFPFERIIGGLQRSNVNFHFGELELTMAQLFHEQGNLRAELDRDSCPALIQECKFILDQYFRSHEPRGSLESLSKQLNDDTASSKGVRERLDVVTFQALRLSLHEDFAGPLDRTAFTLPYADKDAVRYRPRPNSGDSRILFQPEGLGPHIPAQIEKIFSHRRLVCEQWVKEIFLVVQPHLPLSPLESEADPYRAFPTGARLWQRLSDDTPFLVIRVSQIICPFAHNLYKADQRWSIVWPIQRVRIIPSLDSANKAQVPGIDFKEGSCD